MRPHPPEDDRSGNQFSGRACCEPFDGESVAPRDEELRRVEERREYEHALAQTDPRGEPDRRALAALREGLQDEDLDDAGGEDRGQGGERDDRPAAER